MKTAGITGIVAFAAGIGSAQVAGKMNEPKPVRAAFVVYEKLSRDNKPPEKGAQMNFAMIKDGKVVGEKQVFFDQFRNGATTVGTVADKDLPKAARECIEAFHAGKMDALATAPIVPRPEMP